MKTFAIAFLGKRWRWISNCIFDWKALIISFFEWLPHRLFIHWIFSLIIVSSPFGIFPWTIIFKGGWQKPIIRTGRVEYFANIYSLVILPLGFGLLQLVFNLHFVLRYIEIKHLFEKIWWVMRLRFHTWVFSVSGTFRPSALFYIHSSYFIINIIIAIELFWLNHLTPLMIFVSYFMRLHLFLV